MTDREYIWKKPDGSWSKSASFTTLKVAAAARIILGHGPFDLTQDGDIVAANKPRSTILRRLFNRLDAVGIGPVYRVRDGRGNIIFVCREVKSAYKVIDTSGNEHADEFWSWVVATYPQYKPRFAGAYVCKDVAGTSTPSQHSYGNAVDIFFDTFAHQVVVFRDIENGKCPVAVAHAISGDRIWEPPNDEHTYTGEYHSHLHTDYTPSFSGGCGVREP